MEDEYLVMDDAGMDISPGKITPEMEEEDKKLFKEAWEEAKKQYFEEEYGLKIIK